MKDLSHPGHEKSMCCIVGNWTWNGPPLRYLKLRKLLTGKLKRLQEIETSLVAYDTAVYLSSRKNITFALVWIYLFLFSIILLLTVSIK